MNLQIYYSTAQLKSVPTQSVADLVNDQLKTYGYPFRLPENLSFTGESLYCNGTTQSSNQKAKVISGYFRSTKYAVDVPFCKVYAFNNGDTPIAEANGFDVLRGNAEIKIKSPEQLETERLERDQRAKQRKAQEAKERAAKARRAKEIYASAKPVTAHSYLDKKRVALIHNEQWPVKKVNDENYLVVPLLTFGKEGFKSNGIQRIYDNGDKKCLGDTLGAFYPIGNTVNPTEIFVCAGFATALTVYHAKKQDNILVIHAIADSNVPKVFAALVNAYPKLYEQSRITFVADLDIYPTSKGVVPNSGFKTASKLLKQYPLALVAYQPIVDDDFYHDKKPTDFNDVFCLWQDELGESAESAYEFTTPYLNAGLTHNEFEKIFDFQDGRVTEPENAIIAKIQASVRVTEQVRSGERDNAIIEQLATDRVKNQNRLRQLKIDAQAKLRMQAYQDLFNKYTPEQQAIITRAVESNDELSLNDPTFNSFMHQELVMRYFPVKIHTKAIEAVKEAQRGNGYAPFALKTLDFYSEDKIKAIPLFKKGDKVKEKPVDFLTTKVQFTQNGTLKRYILSCNTQSAIYTTPWLPAQGFINEIKQAGLTLEQLFELHAILVKNRELEGKLELDESTYLSEQTDIPEKGVTAYHTPTGSGKTVQVKRIVDYYKMLGKTVVYVAPNRALTNKAARDLGMANYQVLSEHGGINQKTANVMGIVITPHSYHKLQHIDIDVLILDEVNQVRKAVASSPFLKNRPEKNLEKLKTSLESAESVVIADAGIDRNDLDWIAKLRGCDVEDISVYAFTGGKEGSENHIFDEKEQSLAKLKSELQQGKCCYVTCSSKKFSHELRDKAQRWGVPKSKILLVTEQTTKFETENDKENPALDFVNAPNEQIDNYQLVIASPIINSGLSVDTFDERKPREIFAFIDNRVSSAKDVNQMISRFRGKWLSYHLHLEYTEISDFHNRNAVKKIEASIKQRPKDDNPWQSARELHEALNEHVFDIAEKELSEKNKIKDNWIILSILQNLKLVKSTDCVDTTSIKEDMVLAKEAVTKEERNRIKQANEITDARCDMLKNEKKRDLTLAEKAEIEAHAIRKTYGEKEIAEDLLDLDRRGDTRYELKKLTFAIKELREQQLKASLKLQREINITTSFAVELDKKNPLLHADVRHDFFDHMEKIFGLDISLNQNQAQINTNTKPLRAFSRNQCANEALQAFFDWVPKVKDELQAVTGLKITDNFRKDMRWLTLTLAKFGLRLSRIYQKEMAVRFNMPGSHHGEKYYYLEPTLKPAISTNDSERDQQRLLKAINNMAKESEEKYSEYLTE